MGSSTPDSSRVAAVVAPPPPTPFTVALLPSRFDEGATRNTGRPVGLPRGAVASPLRIWQGAAVLPDDDATVKAAKGAAAEEKVAVFEGIRMSSFACAGRWRRQ
jgi:hypothetical protein